MIIFYLIKGLYKFSNLIFILMPDETSFIKTGTQDAILLQYSI